MESPENINAENIMIFKDAMAKMAPLIATMSLPVLIGMIYEQLSAKWVLNDERRNQTSPT
jgi:hypothetical protein